MQKEIIIALASAVGSAALYWLSVAACEVMASRAECDGVDDWQDLFWPRMLKRLSASRYERAKLDVVERKGDD